MSSSPRSTAKNKFSNDQVDELKRRSRRRLVGSIALFLAAIIIVPALIDTDQPPTPSDIELKLPERQSVDAPADLGADNLSGPKLAERQIASKDTEGASESTSAKSDASTDGPPPNLAPSVPISESKVEPKPPKAQIPSDVVPPPAKQAVKPSKESIKEGSKEASKDAATAKATDKAADKSADKAKSIPSIQKEVAPAAKPTTPTDDLIASFAGKETLWVQVAAVADFARAEELKKALLQKGFSAKLETITSNGSKMHRVRVGPIEGQAKADQTKETLAKAGFPGRVVK